MNKVTYVASLLALAILFACQAESKKMQVAPPSFTSDRPTVTVAKVDTCTLTSSINSSGKLEAINKVDLYFEYRGRVEKVMMTNAKSVEKGQLIAQQQTDELAAEYRKVLELKTKADLDILDILLNRGYKSYDTTAVPDDFVKMARVRVGFADINYQILAIKKRIDASKLIAPIDGTLLDLRLSSNTLVSEQEKVCTIIDNRILWVNFLILESEFGLIQKGDPIIITLVALPGKRYKGIVEEIRPQVDKNGFIVVKARVRNSHNDLLDGMNVDIFIEKKTKSVIVVPKKAVVDRENRKVVFVHHDGKALWNYVLTGAQSADSIAILEGLDIGQKIIVEGNVNLAHNTEVNAIIRQ